MKIEETKEGVTMVMSLPEHRLLLERFMPLYRQVVQTEHAIRELGLLPCNQPDCPACTKRDLVMSVGKDIDTFVIQLAQRVLEDPRLSTEEAKAIVDAINKRKEQVHGL